MKTSLLVVLGKDHPGIIASVTGVLFETRCNLEDVSMTVLEGEFAMMVVLSYDKAKKTILDKRLHRLTLKSGLSFFWKDLKASARYSRKLQNDLYLVSAIGRDRTGIVYQISRDLASDKLNILDLNSKILAKASKKAVYALVLEVEIPKHFPIQRLQKKFDLTAKRLKIDLTFKPVERLEL